MRSRSFAKWIYAPALWLSFQTPVDAIPPPHQPLEAAAAREVNSPHPDGCLAAWPVKQTLAGRLMGIVQGSVPEENPPVPAKSFLFLLLDNPVSVCASPSNHYPAFEDVTRIRLASLSLTDFMYVMHKWGSDEIRITSTLNTAQTFGQEPGPVIFDTADFQFCWRRPSNREGTGWKCIGSQALSEELPGPHLQ